MTLHIADLAVYQGGLTLAQLQRAGFGGVNVKVSHGLTSKAVHPNVQTHVQDARAAGLELASFHWLDGSAPGAAQARYAYAEMVRLGLDVKAAHVVDCESNATLTIYLDYCAYMAGLLGRPIATYSGDWWWVPRGWKPSPHSPWLHSAPGAGYLKAYPGDTSAHWAGYGGWPELAAMQYGVGPVAGIDVSMSAVRSMDTWRAMTGEAMAWKTIPASDSLTAEMNKAFPNRDKASDGSIGDGEHSTRSSDHNPDETGATPFEDADSSNEVHAKDLDADLKRAGWTLARAFEIIRKRAAAGTEKRVQNLIFNRRITSRSWGFDSWHDYTGTDPHTGHGHVSFRYGSGAGNPEDITTPWGILAAVESEEAVTPEEIKAIAKASADEILARKLTDPYDESKTPRTVSVESWLRYSPSRGQVEGVSSAVKASGSEIMSLLVAIAGRDEVDTDALAAALAAPLASALVPLLPEDKEVSAATVRDAFRELLSGEQA